MVKCEDCKKEMTTVKECGRKFRCIKIEGKVYERDIEWFDYNVKCHDCGIENRKGNLHHFGCDVERCPKCKGQLISCDCKKEMIGINGNWKVVK